MSGGNGEVPEAKQGRGGPPGPLRRPQGGDRPVIRRRHPRPPLRALPGRGANQVPSQGHPQGLGEEAGEEVARQVLHQARELQPHHAHALHARRGSEGCRHRGLSAVQG